MNDERTRQLVDRIVAVRPTETNEERLVGLTLYRLLAKGSPITAADLAEALSLTPDEAAWMIDLFADFLQRNEDGEVVGFGGLSVVPTEHAFNIPGVNLYTWCAWDTLFIPEIIGKTAEVVSQSPVTGRTIKLTISPDGITSADPEGTALSLVVPDLDDLRQDVRASFCGRVHFFGSIDEAREWARARPGAYVATLEQADRLGRLKNAAQFGNLRS
ncbi:MAG: organomercurial lyase [Gemmatimonadales bacterium]